MVSYIFIGTAILLLLVVLYRFNKRNALKKRRASLESSWGKSKNKNHNFNHIGLLYELIPPDFSAINHIDEETRNDLDFSSLFNTVDHTVSKVGQQYLYAQLLSPTGSAELIKERGEQIEWVAQNEEKRLELQLAFSHLDNWEVYQLPLIFANKLPFNIKSYYFSKILKWLAIFFTIGAFFDLRFIFGIAILFFVNMIFHYLNKKNINQYLQAFIQIGNLVATAEKINSIQTPLVYHNDLSKKLNSVKNLRNSLGLINTFALGKGNDESSALIWIFLEYLKIMFLLEVNAYYNSIKSIDSKKEDLYSIFCHIGKVDSTIAIASFKASLPYSCIPIMTNMNDAANIEIKDAFHPLIIDCVPNSLHIPTGQGTLISGSNMSGKTSFLRTIGVNLLFGQALSLCLAKECRIPPIRLFSSIRISDNIEEGKSYYIQEVERIYFFLEEAKNDHYNFFLLDELFKGTNTLERVAAASAVLSHLNQGKNYVMVATHDLELTQLLKNSFDPYFFSEKVQNNDAIHFDYKIKKGVLPEGNAIKLLKFFQFPETLVEEALHQKQKLFTNQTLLNSPRG